MANSFTYVGKEGGPANTQNVKVRTLRNASLVCLIMFRSFEGQACEPPGTGRWSPPPLDTRNHRKYEDTYRRVGGPPSETMLKLLQCINFTPPDTCQTTCIPLFTVANFARGPYTRHSSKFIPAAESPQVGNRGLFKHQLDNQPCLITGSKRVCTLIPTTRRANQLSQYGLVVTNYRKQYVNIKRTKTQDWNPQKLKAKMEVVGHMARGKDKWSKLITHWYPREGKRKRANNKKMGHDIRKVAGIIWSRSSQESE
ncbi:hypothetical protein EVAR_45882_1 [Eumeta japonica]|uniref:Uncharacterized protein n=1 Tax=Eumeta variegata TaxID=151549 RepID=A0A4C1XSI4_EUMVA|nr:hypothetical protein EVAR_45882_1 [Eumeta japonica]